MLGVARQVEWDSPIYVSNRNATIANGGAPYDAFREFKEKKDPSGNLDLKGNVVFSSCEVKDSAPNTVVLHATLWPKRLPGATTSVSQSPELALEPEPEPEPEGATKALPTTATKLGRSKTKTKLEKLGLVGIAATLSALVGDDRLETSVDSRSAAGVWLSYLDLVHRAWTEIAHRHRLHVFYKGRGEFLVVGAVPGTGASLIAGNARM